MHGITADPKTRARIAAARRSRAYAFNDGLAALFGRAPKGDHHR